MAIQSNKSNQSEKDRSWRFYLLQLPLWSALVLVVSVALLVLFIRSLIPQVDLLRPHLEVWLTERLPFEIEMSHLSGSLFKIDPAVGVKALTLSNQNQVFLVIEDVYFELDTLASLVAGVPRMKGARLAGLELWLEETPDGWQLKGWQNQQTLVEENKTNSVIDTVSATASLRQVLGYIEQLLVQGELNFADLRFNLQPLNDEPLFFSADSMSYHRWSKGRQLFFQLEASTAITQPAELVITFEGETFNAQTSNLTAWFNFPLVSLDDFQALWLTSMQEKADNIQGKFSVEGWLNLNQGQAKLDLQAKNVEILQDKRWQVEFGEAKLTLQGELDNWSVDWEINQLKSGSYYFPKLAGRLGQIEEKNYLQLEELKLDPLVKSLKKDQRLPKIAQQLIKDLSPGGSLKNLFLTSNLVDEFDLQVNLQGIKANTWQGAPLGAGLNGWLQADTKGGQVVFADHPLQLGFPDLYSSVWDFSQAKGRIRWELEGKEVWVIGEDLAVTLPLDKKLKNNVYVSGDFTYFYGANDQRLYLNLGLLPTYAAAHRWLVPERLLEPELFYWLNSALKAGQINKAGFIYAGSIAQAHTAAFQLAIDFTATDFKFQPDWPSLSQAKGQVQVIDGWVKGSVASAKMGTGKLTNASFATKLDNDGKLKLDVFSEVKAPLALFPWLVKNSPLATQIAEPLHDWIYSGEIMGAINLAIPLVKTEQQPSVKLVSQINNGQLTIMPIDLTVTDINGPLNFTLEKGLESVGLTGRVMSQPVIAKFYIEPKNYLSFSAGLAAEDVKTRFNLPKELDFTGITQVQGELSLIPIGELKIISDLQGLALATALPWNKEIQEERKFTLQLDFSVDELPLKLQLADQLDFLMHLNEPLRGSQLHLADKNVAKAILPEEQGLIVTISVDQLGIEPAYTWYSQLNLGEASQSPIITPDVSSPVRITLPVNELEGLNQLNINIAQLNWQKLNLGQLDLDLKNSSEGLKLNFNSAVASGEAWWPSDSEQQLELFINYLHLPVAEDEAPLKPVEQPVVDRATRPLVNDWLADFNPKTLPAAFIKIDDLTLGKKRLGRLTAQLLPQEEGVKLDPLLVSLEESDFSARFDWFTNEQGSNSRVEGVLAGKDLAPALMALTAEKQSPIVSGKHKLSFSTVWLGSPVAFDLQKAQSKLQLELKDGYFPKTDLRLSGISQLFSLLNMDTLLRRLRLDFLDLIAKGVSYDSIKGVYQLEEGYLRTIEPTKIVSSATRMTLTGEVDLIEETLQQELTLVMPVAQSLPLAAVVVGAPQIGAAIWLVQKVFSNLFDTFTEIRYKITGPLNNPKIELQRIF
ncbi:MAG TPA: AsmA-like C-terminal region-containing protein [Marinospirillum sp.]|uniref:YhdP family phospholipid transporter n=1 Tax=Marinospirillum sp. TaxID=2183934 RepID=UPI002B4933E4|nr:AsmA-like C-terminal region-containing protein [Marinospirillum sp.]HKM14324.1 AsmA-like C-terminal region-containing protein [Marinospirillum sp.]